MNKEAFVITMLDGTKIPINDDTFLIGYVALDYATKKEFYAKKIYANTIQGDAGTSELATSSPLLGAMGFLSNCDFFAVGDDDIDKDETKLYKTSAVKCIGFTETAKFTSI
ncbi:hypothetical protein ACDJ35_07145 [Enterococcus faecalis]|uniref:hypothetical protein n=1 Tax=Enterococcus faecalis TaxID=1351 RepID=UPI0020237046|nr:hypothetical protein [Enterococcus faecalis]MCL8363575.1 hypothetical protein [Enterococcus faecalis]MDK6477879.1 hypothetical protein [Enterococcus faecalis]MDT2025508.1 hypothetical protein [Enterococcus faecalis]